MRGPGRGPRASPRQPPRPPRPPRGSFLSTRPGPDGASSGRGALGLGALGAGGTGWRRAEGSCARSPLLPHSVGGPGRSGRSASYPRSSLPCFHFTHLASLPPQEFPSRCPLGDLQATPLPRWAAVLLGRGSPVHPSQAGPCTATTGSGCSHSARRPEGRGGNTEAGKDRVGRGSEADWLPPGVTEPGAWSRRSTAQGAARGP